MRGYRTPESEEDHADEELDGEAFEKFIEALPMETNCYACCSAVSIHKESAMYLIEDFRTPYVDCPKCGGNVAVYIPYGLQFDVKAVLPIRSFVVHDFVWPFRNWWRRRVRHYTRKGTLSYRELV